VMEEIGNDRRDKTKTILNHHLTIFNLILAQGIRTTISIMSTITTMEDFLIHKDLSQSKKIVRSQKQIWVLI
jgi:hypothetical protein